MFILYRKTEKRVRVQCWLLQTEHLWYKSALNVGGKVVSVCFGFRK